MSAKQTPRLCSSATLARTASRKVITNAKRLVLPGDRNLYGRSGMLLSEFPGLGGRSGMLFSEFVFMSGDGGGGASPVAAGLHLDLDGSDVGAGGGVPHESTT